MKQKRQETLTSRRRVLNAIDRLPLDRMPIDLGVHFSTGISAFAYHNLRKHLGLGVDGIEVPDIGQFLARVDEDVLERFHCDAMLLNPPWRNPRRWNIRGEYTFLVPEWLRTRTDEEGQILVEGPGSTARMPKGGFFFDGDFPPRPNEGYREDIVRRAEVVYKETEYFTAYMQLHAFFSGDVDYLCDMLLEPGKILEQNARALERELEHARWAIESMGRYVQCICLNSDLGMQAGPYCRPSVYQELCAPFLKKLCDFIHENSDFRIFLHTCGSIRPLIPTLIECGVDILNPVQISAADMNPQTLKDEFGDKIAFWGGGCNTQNVLGRGTPQDVARNVRELTHIFKPGGGFIFNQVHNVMGDVPPENIVAMLDTAYENSFYD